MGRKLLTERTVIELARHHKVIEITGDEIITALARDKAKQLGVRFQRAEKKSVPPSAERSLKPDAEKKIALGADHGGFALKEQIKKLLQSLNYEVVDVGTHSTQPVDYPDIAQAVAQLVSEGDCSRGIILDGAGIGSCCRFG